MPTRCRRFGVEVVAGVALALGAAAAEAQTQDEGDWLEESQWSQPDGWQAEGDWRTQGDREWRRDSRWQSQSDWRTDDEWFARESGQAGSAQDQSRRQGDRQNQQGQSERRQPDRQQPGRARSPETKTAHELLPLRQVQRQFAVTAGENKGERLMMSLERPGQGPGYVLQFGEQYRLHLEKAETVYVTRLDLLQQNKAVVYDPPVELIPSTVEAGRTMYSQGTATVYELDSGERSRAGSYEHKLQRVTKADFNLPQGQAQGYLIDLIHTIDFDNADMSIDLELGTDDRGLIYWRYRSDLEKMGLFGSTTISQYEAVGPGTEGAQYEETAR